MEISKTYEPQSLEKKWYGFWEARGYFQPSESSQKKPFTILIPPPNVTGILHMGHVLNNTLQDVVVRYHRMNGEPTLWLPGVDHAGIATQNVVEKTLAKEGSNRHELGREKLVERIWQWKNEKGGIIIDQLKLLGASCDWSRQRFTMDEMLSKAVKEVFVSLYDDGLIYKGKYIINWCPRCVTALANDEVEHADESGKLWHIRYPYVEQDANLAGGISSAASECCATTEQDANLAGGNSSAASECCATTEQDANLAGGNSSAASACCATTEQDANLAGGISSAASACCATMGSVTVATTRPETMLGDVAVAVNPKDERYKHLIGKELILPLTGRKIPVIADDYVDKDFGTGCVKVTPAHDPNDFEIGQRHNLQQLLIMNEHGIMNEAAGAEFAGMERYACREKVLKMLEEQGLLEKTETHEHAVGHCYRCDTVIEPYLSDQWFVKMKPLAIEAIKVVESGEVKFQPERWTKVYMHWMNNIRDWCISRQIWWGHRIPAYYCSQCNYMAVAKEMPEECPVCGCKHFTQDEDVLDTWFSSWLWPFSTMGWPDETPDLQRFLPTNVLITAPEIIYLWVARMIMSTLHFKGVIPFNTVLLHGTVRDEIGRKMSKSLGNSPDPIDIIGSVGADALRFSMIFNTPKGADVAYSDSMLELGRNFANKMWNAYRFIMMNAETIEGLPTPGELKLELADKWIISRLQEVTAEVRGHYENLRLNDAANVIFKFLWDEFCSWYIELSKDRLQPEADLAGRLTAKYVLLDTMQKGMRLLHPIMPFITEEIWQSIKEIFPLEEEALIIAAFPEADSSLIDSAIDDEMRFVQESITAIRNLRKQVNLAPSQEIELVIRYAETRQQELFASYMAYFRKLAKVSAINGGVGMEKPKAAIAAVVRNIEIFMPLSGLIDLSAEAERLNKQAEKLEKELNSINNKLNNPNFMANAKEEVIGKEREKYQEVNTKLELLKQLISDLQV